MPCGSIRSGTCCGEPYRSRNAVAPATEQPNTWFRGNRVWQLPSKVRHALGKFSWILDVSVALVRFGQAPAPVDAVRSTAAGDFATARPQIAKQRKQLERDEVVLVVAGLKSLGVGHDHHAGAVRQRCARIAG